MIHATIKFNVDVLLSHTFTDVNYDFTIYNLTNYVDFYSENDAHELRFEMRDNVNQKFVYVALVGSSMEDEFYNQEILNISDNGHYFVCDCDFADADIPNLIQLINWGIIELDFDGRTALITYHQNSENDVIKKSITPVSIIQGKFNHSIGLKNLNIDLENFYDNQFNYIYIPKLNRYYYVDFIELISANITRLHLKEDVLMSWKNLIRLQNAFVTRFEQSGEIRLVDSRRPLEDVSEFTSDVSIENTDAEYTFVNITPKTTFTDNDLVFLVNTKSTAINLTHSDTPSPDSQSLPNIDSIESNRDWHYLLSMNDMGAIVNANVLNDVPTSSISSIIFLPFTTTLFNPEPNHILYAGNYKLASDGTWDNLNSSTPKTPKYVNQVFYGNSPYFVIADFRILFNDKSYLEHKPYAYYEIYIPFVSWVEIDIKKVIGSNNNNYSDRLLIYYSLDYTSGIATAYLYDYDKKCILWSGSCQMGIKMDLTTSNIEENTKQKQASNLNMILSLFASTGAIAGGIFSKNPITAFGGVMSGTKAIANNVMTYQTIFDRLQTTFGTPISTLYTHLSVKVVKTSRKKLFEDNSGEFTIYKHIQGLPYNRYTSLNSFGGGLYVEVGEIHFNPNGENIYQDEISEVVELLQNGVIF